jgi:hypothetical protein
MTPPKSPSQISLDPAPLPWNTGSSRLWSLFDMLEADTKLAFFALAEIEELRRAIQKQQELTDVAEWPTPDLVTQLKSVLNTVELATEPLYLKTTLVSIDYIEKMYEFKLPQRTMSQMLVDLDHLQNAFISEMEGVTFLYIAPERQQFYVGDTGESLPFGAAVAAAFPSGALDMREASNAYALERWPACVFHLMRVLESGLSVLAARFNVTMDKSTWHQVIEAIEGKIRKVDPVTAGTDWKQQQKDFLEPVHDLVTSGGVRLGGHFLDEEEGVRKRRKP